MNKQNKRGASSISSGGLGHKVVSALGGAIILGSLASEANAKTTGHSRADSRPNRTNVVHGFFPFFFIGDYGGNIPPISSLPQYHPGLAGDTRFGWVHSGYLAPDIVYDMSFAGRVGPDGIPHTGYVTRDIFCMPSTLKSRIVPYDSGRGDIARRYSDARAANLTQRVQGEAEGLSDKEKLERYKAAVEFRRSRVKEVRAAEGLKEFDLFNFYSRYIGKKCEIHPLSMKNQTVGLYIFFQDDPTLVMVWYDKKTMDEHSQQDTRCKRARDDYMCKLKDLRELNNNGEITLFEMTETGIEGIINRFQDISIRLKLPLIDPNAFLLQLQESQPYILGPNYNKPKK